MEEGRGWGGTRHLLNTELACVCCSAGSLHPPAHAPLLHYQQQVCGTNEGLQVLPTLLFESYAFAFHSFLTGQRKLHAFKLILIGLLTSSYQWPTQASPTPHDHQTTLHYSLYFQTLISYLVSKPRLSLGFCSSS